MDSARLLERIEAGERKIEEEVDGVKVCVELEAADTLSVLVKKIEVESPKKGVLQDQAKAVVDKLTYLGGPLKVIEVDGVAYAAQIRSVKPEQDKFVEVVLRGGTSASVERRPDATLHVSKGDFERLVRDLTSIL